MTEHDFTGELAITALLYKEANCLSPALYYKSCKICMLSSKGTASEATFASGEKNPATGTPKSRVTGSLTATATGDSTRRHLEVDRGAHQGGTADCLAPALCEVCQHSYGELGPHHFVDQVNEYRLKSAATCTSPAVYHQSCSTCGAQGTETFTNGKPLGHDYGAWTSNEDGTHTRVCATMQRTRKPRIATAARQTARTRLSVRSAAANTARWRHIASLPKKQRRSI